MHRLSLRRLEPQIELRQAGWWPTLRCAVSWRFADQHQSAGAKERSCALRSHRRSAEATGNDQIDRVPQGDIATGLFSPAAPDGHPSSRVKRLLCFVEERHTTGAGLDEEPSGVGPHQSGQNESRNAPTRPEIDHVGWDDS